MFTRATRTVLLFVASLALFSQNTDAQAGTYSSWTDFYYNYDLYFGVEETVYDLYVVYADGSEELYHTYTSSSSLSYQMYAFAEGRRPYGVVDWYYVKDTRVINWYYYSNYSTWAQTDANAAWLEDMGYEIDVRLVYRPSYKTSSYNFKLR